MAELKIKNNLRKKGMLVIMLYITNTSANFQSEIFIFGSAMVPKPGKSDDVNLLK